MTREMRHTDYSVPAPLHPSPGVSIAAPPDPRAAPPLKTRNEAINCEVHSFLLRCLHDEATVENWSPRQRRWQVQQLMTQLNAASDESGKKRGSSGRLR
jgi:hypothetical protein